LSLLSAGAAALLALLAGGGGCKAPSPAEAALPPPPVFNGTVMSPVIGAESRPSDRYALLVRLMIHPVQVPFGTVSRSERLWRYVDEEIGDVATLSALQRNGFRVGRAKLDGWPPVRKLLGEMAGKTLETGTHVGPPGQVVPVELKEHLDDQRIFIFSGTGQLRGYDFPPGDNVLNFICHLNAEDPSEVLLQMAPVVRSTRKVSRLVKTPVGYVRRSRSVSVPLEALELNVRVPQGQYVIIGPGAISRRATSPGNRFLVGVADGLRYETLLVVIPQVFAAELPREAG